MSFQAGFPITLKFGPISLRMGTGTNNALLRQLAGFFYPPAQVTVQMVEQGVSYNMPDGESPNRNRATSEFQQVAQARTRTPYGWPVVLIWPIVALVLGIPSAISISTSLLALYLYARTHIARHVLIYYKMAPVRRDAFERVDIAVTALSVRASVWKIREEKQIAGTHKTEITIAKTPKETVLSGRGLPRRFRSNIRFPQFKLANYVIFFAPDALYVETKKTLHVIPYERVSIQVSTIHFREEGQVPAHALIAGKTNLHVTKSGIADRRFSLNPTFPVVIYGKMVLIVPGVLNEVFLNTSPSQLQALSMAIQNMLDTASAKGEPDERNATLRFDALIEQAIRKAEGAARSVRVGFAVAADWPFEDANVSYTVANTVREPQYELPPSADADTDLSQFVLNPITIRGKLPVQTLAATRGGYASPVLKARANEINEIIWVAPGCSRSVAGVNIPDGMIYIGSENRSSYLETDPCIIDPNVAVLDSVDDNENQDLGYWPSYAKISPARRFAYLKWLSAGRRDQQANIGYVYLFFYGLERRAIGERDAMLASPGEREAIITAVEQLLHIHRSTASFVSYAEGFLLYLRSLDAAWRAYKEEPGSYQGHSIVPISIALALGQLARDSIPLSASWALYWVRSAVNINKRTPAIRCAEKFDQLFSERYRQQFPNGYTLGINKSLLKNSYYPASSALRGQAVSLVSENVPDVTMLVRHIGKLQRLVDACTAELDPYSRALARSTSNPLALSTTMLLPQLLWPEHLQIALAGIMGAIQADFHLTTVAHVLASFALQSPYDKDDLAAASAALAAVGISAEPPMSVALKDFGDHAKICLFKTTSDQSVVAFPPAYEAAKATLALASVIVHADGAVALPNTDYLLAQVTSWPDLTPAHQQRLRAYLHVVTHQPPSLQAATKRLKNSPPELSRKIGHLLYSLTLADGVVTPEERKILRRIYASLSLGPDLVDADLYELGYFNVNLATISDIGSSHRKPLDAARNTPITTPSAQAHAAAPPSFRLDPARLAQIIKETEQVAGLLAQVFDTESDTAAEPQVATDRQTAPEMMVKTAADVADLPSTPTRDGALLGLDDVHSALVRQLLTRALWRREELQSMATEAGVMLSGALERINDACFECMDCALLDGEDPIEVDLDLRDEIL